MGHHITTHVAANRLSRRFATTPCANNRKTHHTAYSINFHNRTVSPRHVATSRSGKLYDYPASHTWNSRQPAKPVDGPAIERNHGE